MTQRFYLDTNIWRDYFEDRRDNMRPLGEFAFRFLSWALEKNNVLFYSSSVMEELLKYYSIKRVEEMFKPYEAVIARVSIQSAQIQEAKIIASKRSETHWQDVLHAIATRDNEAVLITRDKGFESLHDICPIAKPEEVNLE